MKNPSCFAWFVCVGALGVLVGCGGTIGELYGDAASDEHDGGVHADLAPPDLLADQAPPGDLAVADDMTVPGDMTAPSDMAPPGDMTPPDPIDPCACAGLGDGFYCGGYLAGCGGDPDVLYRCRAKATWQSSLCGYGCHSSPSGVPDFCEAGPGKPPADVPLGKGIWIWTFDQYGPSVKDAVALAEQVGIGFVLIKSGEQATSYSQFALKNVAPFVARGIEVYGWPYVSPGNLDAKAAAIATQASVPGVSGIILDVETEFVGHASDATALCQGIRQRVPRVFLGYTSFGWVDYHLDFPYAQFDQHCGDAFLPQTYWDLPGAWASAGPIGGLMKGREDYRKHGWTAPVWPAQDNYGGTNGPGSNPASVANLNLFFNAAGPRSSLWRWPSPGDLARLAPLDQLDWAN